MNDCCLKILNELQAEVFKKIEWGENHGNMGLISKQEVSKIINSHKTGEKK